MLILKSLVILLNFIRILVMFANVIPSPLVSQIHNRSEIKTKEPNQALIERTLNDHSVNYSISGG